jgi:hypothetical protein
VKDTAWLEAIRTENRRKLGLEGMNYDENYSDYEQPIDVDYRVVTDPGTGYADAPYGGNDISGMGAMGVPLLSRATALKLAGKQVPAPSPAPQPAVPESLLVGLMAGAGAVLLATSLGVTKHKGKTRGQLGLLGLGLLLFAGYRTATQKGMSGW